MVSITGMALRGYRRATIGIPSSIPNEAWLGAWQFAEDFIGFQAMRQQEASALQVEGPSLKP